MPAEIQPEVRTDPLPTYMLDYNTKIVAEAHVGGLGSVEQVVFRWEGSGDVARLRRDTVRFRTTLDERDIKVGSVLTLGQLRLRVIDTEPPSREYFVMHDGWRAQLRVWHWKLAQPLDLIYRRLILTLAVWGLASVSFHYEPTWRDIHVVRRLQKRMRKDS